MWARNVATVLCVIVTLSAVSAADGQGAQARVAADSNAHHASCFALQIRLANKCLSPSGHSRMWARDVATVLCVIVTLAAVSAADGQGASLAAACGIAAWRYYCCCVGCPLSVC